MSEKVIRIFPCNFPEELLISYKLGYSRDLLTDEFYVENPPKELLDFLTFLILDNFQDKEYHDMDNHDGMELSEVLECALSR